MKQIAGRAGRYGLHSDNAVGEATTLHKADLASLRKSMATPTPAVSHAVLDHAEERLVGLSKLYARGTPLSSIYETAHRYSLVQQPYILHKKAQVDTLLLKTLEHVAPQLDMGEGLIFLRAPLNVSNPAQDAIARNMMKEYAQKNRVDIASLFNDTPFLDALNAVKATKEQSSGQKDVDKAELQSLSSELPNLEGIHKALTVYLWMSYRIPPAFYQQQEAFAMKAEVEGLIEWVLSVTSSQRRRRGVKVRVELATESRQRIQWTHERRRATQ